MAGGVAGHEIVEANGSIISNSGIEQIIGIGIDCPTGKVVVGGGGQGFVSIGLAIEGQADVMSIYPIDSNSWSVGFGKRSGSNWTADEQLNYRVFAVCVNSTP